MSGRVLQTADHGSDDLGAEPLMSVDTGRGGQVVILIGLQASGKSTFYRQRLAATHVHVSKDNFRNARNRQRRQLQMIGAALAANRDVAVDNTNPSPGEWQPIIEAAKVHGARVVGCWFAPDLPASLARNAARPSETRVPAVGLYATIKRLRRPTPDDGFDALYTVAFDGAGGFTLTPIWGEDAGSWTLTSSRPDSVPGNDSMP